MSFVDLYQETTDSGVLTLWRSEQNASATVTITTSLSGITATAYTNASGPNFGRIDITFGTQAAGSYAWSATIAAAEVWTGHVNVGPTGRASAFLASTSDITTESSPVVTIPDAPDAAENFVPDGGTTGQVLAKSSNADGDTEWVAAGGGSLQDAYDGSTANPEILTSVAGGAVQIRRGTGADTDAVFAVQNGAGSATFSVTGAGVVTVSGTVDGRDISADGATLDAHVGNTSNPHSITAVQVGADPAGTASAAVATHVGHSDPHTQYQRESEKGTANGYASLNAGMRVAEAIEKIYETGGTTMNVGAVGDATFLLRSGVTCVGSRTKEAVSGALDVNCTNSDSARAFKITASGSNGAVIQIFVGTRNPEGLITGNPGDTYFRVSGTDSTRYTYCGASAGTTGWVSIRPTALWTTANYTVTSTTAADIAPSSGATFSNIAIPAGNRMYKLSVAGTYTGTATTITFQVGVEFSQTPTYVNVRSSVGASAASAQTWAEKGLLADGAFSDNVGSIPASGTAYPFYLEGYFVANATPGTLSIQAKLEQVDASNTLDVVAGAFLVLTPL